MAVKLEISGNYLKITDGSQNPIRYPYRDVTFQANDADETIQLFMGDMFKPLGAKIDFADNPATGSVTINTTNATHATGTVVCAGVLAGDTVTVNGLLYTAVAGAKADNTEFSIDTGNNECATDLAASITADARVGTLDDVTAIAGTNTVTITAATGGTADNAITLVSSDGTRLAVSGATLTGGLNNAQVTGITVNAIQIMSGAVATGDGVGVLASAVAANINAYTSIPNYTAVAVGGVITITSVTDGTAVNGYAVASTVSNATKTDANMAGAGAGIVNSGGTPFATWAALIDFLEDKTGGETI